MRNKSFLPKVDFPGVTVGGSGGGRPVPLVVLTIIVLIMAVITVFDSAWARPNYDQWKKNPFKCTSCSDIQRFTIRDLQKNAKIPAK